MDFVSLLNSQTSFLEGTNAKAKQHRAITKVTGVNTVVSVEFNENIFPRVFKEKTANMIQIATRTIRTGIGSLIYLESSAITIKKKKFRRMEIDSNTIIWSHVSNLPPQTIEKGTAPDMIIV